MKWKHLFGGANRPSEPQDEVPSVHGEESSAAPEPKVMQTFRADAPGLALYDLLGDVIVKNGGPGITLTVYGRQSRIDTLEFETTESNWFSIKGDAEQKRSEGYILFDGDAGVLVNAASGGTKVTVTTGSRGPFTRLMKKVMHIAGIKVLDPEDRLKFVLSVPVGTNFHAQGIAGTIRAGEAVLGITRLRAEWSSLTTFGTVKEADCKTADNSKLEIGCVDGGPLRIRAGWSSTASVKSGTVERLLILARDHAAVQFDGTAGSGEIHAGWSARVTAQDVSGDLLIKANDHAVVSVNGGAYTSLNVNAGWSATVDCQGSASVAEIILKDHASCDVGQVENLTARLGWSSTLDVGAGDIEVVDIATGDHAEVTLNGHVSDGQIITGWNGSVKARSYGPAVKRHARDGKITTF